nr:MAG TPA: hypothetical protein [Caudoviricetes sp.]
MGNVCYWQNMNNSVIIDLINLRSGLFEDK